MRIRFLTGVAAAFVLSAVGSAPYVAHAYPTPAQMKKDGEIKNPVKADAAIAKDEAKDARKKAHKARRYATLAAHKARTAERKAAKAEHTPG